MFQKCCCCITLRTGVVILACMGIMGTVLTLRNFIGGLLVAASYPDQKHYALILTMYATVVMLIFANLVTYICLLYGAYKEQASLIMPYLIVGMFYLIASGCFSTYELIVADTFMWENVLYLISCIMGAYFWICVLSYYKHLRARNNRQPNVNFVLQSNEATAMHNSYAYAKIYEA